MRTFAFTKGVSSTSGWGQAGAGWRDAPAPSLGPAALPNEQRHCFELKDPEVHQPQIMGKEKLTIKVVPRLLMINFRVFLNIGRGLREAQ